MIFLMLACANNAGNPDNTSSEQDYQDGESCGEPSEMYPYGWVYDGNLEMCVEADGIGGFASCEALASSFGETPWVPADGADTLISLDPDGSYPRPCLAVAWEIAEDPGYQVSVAMDNPNLKVPIHGEDEFPVYWVIGFDAYSGIHLFDPENDPGGYEGLPDLAYDTSGMYAKVPLNTYQFAE